MITQTFACRTCGEEAGTVALLAAGEPLMHRDDASQSERDWTDTVNLSAGRARVATLTGLGRVMSMEFDVDRVVEALASADADALHRLDVEWVPWWCPTCAASYCADHWETWHVFDEGFLDETRGRCPDGHERMLLD